jgi:hypothetical protein
MLNKLKGNKRSKTYRIVIAFIFIFLALILTLFIKVVLPNLFPKNRLESSLRKSIQSNRGGIITIHDLTTFEWDRMDIYTPYSTYKDAKGKTIDIDEGECLLVFTKKGLPVSLVKYNRFYGDFSGLYRKGGYSPLDARFKVPGGTQSHWLKLEWVQDKGPTSRSLRSFSVMQLFTSNSQFYVTTQSTYL